MKIFKRLHLWRKGYIRATEDNLTKIKTGMLFGQDLTSNYGHDVILQKDVLWRLNKDSRKLNVCAFDVSLNIPSSQWENWYVRECHIYGITSSESQINYYQNQPCKWKYKVEVNPEIFMYVQFINPRHTKEDIFDNEKFKSYIRDLGFDPNEICQTPYGMIFVTNNDDLVTILRLNDFKVSEISYYEKGSRRSLKRLMDWLLR